MTFALLQQAAQQPQAQGPAAFLSGPLPMLLGMGLLFYFLLWRPQNKARKEQEARLAKLKSGDEVVLNSGFYAVIDRVDEKDARIIYLKLGNNVVKAKRQAVVALASEPDTQN
ncbi:MAG TPA: preprotein translocase subunit YajC [Holophagaceae bacterium]|nr:preprotein translocase subunit YajC [Holophagaceae bacterium]